MADSVQVGQWYTQLYTLLCGKSPYVRFWHFQWLSAIRQRRDLTRLFPVLEGCVLDVGCGDKPYRNLIGSDRYVGLDIRPEAGADIVVDPKKPWPLEDGKFLSLLCIEVINDVENLDFFVKEVSRVLGSGGQAIFVASFIFNDKPHTTDCWRFTAKGLSSLFTDTKKFEILEISKQGGIGSAIGLLLLNWIECQTLKFKLTRYLKALGLPVWMVLCACVNAIGLVLDSLDGTGCFYPHVMIRVRRL